MEHIRITFTVDSCIDDYDEDIGAMSPADVKQAVEKIVNNCSYEELGRWFIDEGTLKVEVVE